MVTGNAYVQCPQGEGLVVGSLRRVLWLSSPRIDLAIGCIENVHYTVVFVRVSSGFAKSARNQSEGIGMDNFLS